MSINHVVTSFQILFNSCRLAHVPWQSGPLHITDLWCSLRGWKSGTVPFHVINDMVPEMVLSPLTEINWAVMIVRRMRRKIIRTSGLWIRLVFWVLCAFCRFLLPRPVCDMVSFLRFFAYFIVCFEFDWLCLQTELLSWAGCKTPRIHSPPAPETAQVRHCLSVSLVSAETYKTLNSHVKHKHKCTLQSLIASETVIRPLIHSEKISALQDGRFSSTRWTQKQICRQAVALHDYVKNTFDCSETRTIHSSYITQHQQHAKAQLLLQY